MSDDDHSPLESPEGNWWNQEVNRRESIWLGISGAWAVSLFGWMVGWTQFGDQNQTGQTYEVSTERYRQKVQSFKEAAGTLEVDGEELLVPDGNDVYVGALQWAWDGLPVVLRPGETYKFHLGSYDVQHGFGVRPEDNLSKQISLQVLPGYEWVVEMSFDETGTYHVVCNEFCGVGHRSMHGTFVVQDHEPVETGSDAGDASEAAYDGWFTSQRRGGATGSFGGEPTDATGQSEVTVEVGAQGNGGPYAFAPTAVQVSSGTTVNFEWVSDNHNVVVASRPDGADWQGVEALENEGYSASATFEEAGVYEYYCEPHVGMGMKGVVEVV
ncbi:plastocyanin/azurin family copper-binding protein [Halobacterium sp. CBA1126]|uniref:plastocyanin/azurin family copper-binding protein n=1 Tax=Halobacterium sp. CBA1126 TaxID=2668074 RepID=UPI001E50C6CC|nr:plastocyanin/azurin family copper-binding protein [Halobacterium sp. CBA1126]